MGYFLTKKHQQNSPSGPSREELWGERAPGKVLEEAAPSHQELRAKEADRKDNCTSWEMFLPSLSMWFRDRLSGHLRGHFDARAVTGRYS